MAKPTDEQKKEFKRLFNFPHTLDTGAKTFQRADLISEIIEGKKEPVLVQLTRRKPQKCE